MNHANTHRHFCAGPTSILPLERSYNQTPIFSSPPKTHGHCDRVVTPTRPLNLLLKRGPASNCSPNSIGLVITYRSLTSEPPNALVAASLDRVEEAGVTRCCDASALPTQVVRPARWGDHSFEQQRCWRRTSIGPSEQVFKDVPLFAMAGSDKASGAASVYLVEAEAERERR